jgi:hypothetical protein
MSPEDWIQTSCNFCNVALQVGLQLWKARYPASDGLLYIGKPDMAKQLQLVNRRLVAASELQKTRMKKDESKNL